MSGGSRQVRYIKVLAILLALPGALQAQSCALCFQSAAASGSVFIQALRSGILILLFPPLVIFAGVALTAYRKRNVFHPKQDVSVAVAANVDRRAVGDAGHIFAETMPIPKSSSAATGSEREMLTDTLA